MIQSFAGSDVVLEKMRRGYTAEVLLGDTDMMLSGLLSFTGLHESGGDGPLSDR